MGQIHKAFGKQGTVDSSHRSSAVYRSCAHFMLYEHIICVLLLWRLSTVSSTTVSNSWFVFVILLHDSAISILATLCLSFFLLSLDTLFKHSLKNEGVKFFSHRQERKSGDRWAKVHRSAHPLYNTGHPKHLKSQRTYLIVVVVLGFNQPSIPCAPAFVEAVDGDLFAPLICKHHSEKPIGSCTVPHCVQYILQYPPHPTQYPQLSDIVHPIGPSNSYRTPYTVSSVKNVNLAHLPIQIIGITNILPRRHTRNTMEVQTYLLQSYNPIWLRIFPQPD